MSNEFKWGWHINSKETQERLFELGYKWFVGGKEVGYLDKKYIITYENGRLTWGRDEHVSGRPRGTQLDKEDNIVSNGFKRGWYLNSKETQKRLFELGYEWDMSGREFRHLDEKYIFTHEDGSLTHFHHLPIKGTPRGTQLDEVGNLEELVTKGELKSALKTISKLESCKGLSELQLSNGVLEYLVPDSLYGYEVSYKGNIDDEDTSLDELLSVVNQDYNKKKELKESLEKLLYEAENIKKQIEEL